MLFSSSARRRRVLSLLFGIALVAGLGACAPDARHDAPALELRDGDAARILGGTEVEAGDALLDFVVAIEARGENDRPLECTGTLIHRRVVLTAAHCVDTPELFTASARIRFRTRHFGADTETPTDVDGRVGTAAYVRGAVGVLRPPRWDELLRTDPGNRERLRYDVALVILDLPAPAGARPVPLDPMIPSFTNLPRLTTVGFGAEGGSLDIVSGQRELLLYGAGPLRQVTVMRSPVEDGAPHFDTFQNSKGICHGDSGAPALVRAFGRWVQIGVASFVTNNGRNVCRRKGYFLKLGYASADGKGSMYDWIQRTLNDIAP